jgi:hypothetical protein
VKTVLFECNAAGASFHKEQVPEVASFAKAHGSRSK